MPEPQVVIEALHNDLTKLDDLSKAIYVATDELCAAEEAWEELLDLTVEELKDRMAEDGRKGDPAEHYAVSVCRKQHRAEYQRLRRAKRDLERLQILAQNRRQMASGHQSELALLREEAKVTPGSGSAQPAWTPEAAAA